MSYYCESCGRRFYLPPQANESNEAYIHRNRMTASTICVFCGARATKCQSEKSSAIPR